MTSYEDMFTVKSKSIGNIQEFCIHIDTCICVSINEQKLLESIFETILDDIGDRNVCIFDLTIEFCFTNVSKTLHLSQLNSQNCSCFDIMLAMQEQRINFMVPADLHICVTKIV